MGDVVDLAVHSQVVANVRGRAAPPEMIVRGSLNPRGFRYRLHRQGLLGRLDLVFPGRPAILRVLGWFWYRHGCELFKWIGLRGRLLEMGDHRKQGTEC